MKHFNGKIIVVSRHAGAVEWLRQRGIKGEVIAHVENAEQVRGAHVIGNVPMHLAEKAFCVSTIDLPNLLPEQRGKDLSPAEMDAVGARLSTYFVCECNDVAQATNAYEALFHGW